MAISTENLNRLKDISKIDRELAKVCESAPPYPSERILMRFARQRRELVDQFLADQLASRAS